MFRKAGELSMLDNIVVEEYLFPHKDRIRAFFLKNGTAATIRFIKSAYKLKIKGETVRKLLQIPKSNHNLIMELKLDAWRTCGYSNKSTSGGRGCGKAGISKKSARNIPEWNTIKGGLETNT